MVEPLIDRYLAIRSDDFQEIVERLARDFPGELDICIKLAAEGGSLDRPLAEDIIQAGSAARHLMGYQILQVDQSRAFLKMSMFSRWLQRRYGKHA